MVILHSFHEYLGVFSFDCTFVKKPNTSVMLHLLTAITKTYNGFAVKLALITLYNSFRKRDVQTKHKLYRQR